MQNYARDYVNPQNVYESMRPLVNLCSYLGILPICMVGRRPNRRFAVTRLFYVTTVMHLLLFVTALWRSMRSGSLFSHFFEFDTFTAISELFQLMTAFAAMGVVYAVCFANRYSYVAAVDALARVDRGLRRLSVRHDHWASFVWTLWNMLASVVVFTFYVAGCVVLVKYAGQSVSVSTFVSYFMPHTIVAQITFHHRIWVRQIVNRVQHLNGV